MKHLLHTLKIVISLGSIVALIYVLSHHIRLHDFNILLSHSEHPWRDLLSLILLVLTGLMMKSLRLYHLIAPFGFAKSLPQCFKIQIVSISLAMFTPGRLGEFIKIYLLAGTQKQLMAGATLLCVFERLLDLGILTVISLLLCLLAFQNQQMTLAVALLGALMLIGSLMFMRADRLLARFGPMLHQYLPLEFNEYRSHLLTSSPLTLFYTLMAWAMDGMLQWHILEAAGYTCSLPLIIGINAIVTIMGILSILPIGLGTTDLSAIYLYTSLLALPHSVIVFLLWAGRLIGLPTLFILLVPAILSDKSLWPWLLRKKQIESQ